MFIEIIPNWHPLFVHFTIALFTTATLMIVGSIFVKSSFKEKILECGYLNLWLGCLFTFITVGAGFYAYNTVAHDEPSHLAMTNHKNWALVTASIFCLLTLWSLMLYRTNQKQNKFFAICLLAATGILSITGWKGGEVVYRYGLGVISMPNSDTHQHNHADGHARSHNEDTKTESGKEGKIVKEEAHDHSKHSHKADAKKPAVRKAVSSKVKEQSSEKNSEEEEHNHESHSHSH